jgi:hypothetical protein
MNRKPSWVWKQQSAVTRFLIVFYARRVMRIICVSLPTLPCGSKPPACAVPRPARRRPAVNTAKLD